MKNYNWKGKNGPLLIAEIGGNHEGNFEQAKKLVKLAFKTQVDIIKLQLYHGRTLVSPFESKDRFNHFQKFELSKKENIYLAEMCIDNGFKYLASVWDLKILDWIDKYLDYYKIGSGDLTAFPIIEGFAKKGKPIILSTGLSTMNEIIQTIRFIQKVNPIYENKNYLSLLQCTSSYPTADEEVNLLAIQYLKEKTGMPVGYSDHTLDDFAIRLAYTLGAEIIEFHFTDSRKGKIFRDHQISLTMPEVINLTEFIKKREKIDTLKNFNRAKIIMGNKNKEPTKNEVSSNNLISFRRGVYSKKALKKGHIINEKDLVFLRPNHGTDVRDYKSIIGKKVLKNIHQYERIEVDNIF
jgi:N-acetylneuraminate synthase/N,N'-diacetyllegionaminate synthase